MAANTNGDPELLNNHHHHHQQQFAIDDTNGEGDSPAPILVLPGRSGAGSSRSSSRPGSRRGSFASDHRVTIVDPTSTSTSTSTTTTTKGSFQPVPHQEPQDDLKKDLTEPLLQACPPRMDVKNMDVDGVSFDDYLRSLVYQQIALFKPTTTETPGFSVADPGPLGLSAFAVTTLILSVVNARAVDRDVGGVVIGPALFYGGLAQLLAGMWEFKRKNLFGATAFTSYGAFWMSFAIVQILTRVGIVNFGEQAGDAIGLFLIGYTFFTFYMWIASWKHNWGIVVTFTTLLITFILLVMAEYGAISSTAGGIMGIITAACAMYTAAAGVINDSFTKPILPLQIDRKKYRLEIALKRRASVTDAVD